jgi:hypothetical protein
MKELLPILGIIGAALILSWVLRRLGSHPERAVNARRERAPR